ncbi:MAG: Coenzyme F420 hydrogenase/dehydrogenase, beta subunit C-terminal domain [Bdellovibrionota bacterium]
MHSVMRSMFGQIQPLDDIHGQFDSGYLAYATDQALRSASASGGALTAMLVSLLERGVIDGALLVRPHKVQKHAGEAFIARTKTEILEARGSKYAITPTNVAFQEIANVPGRYAIVGLPCQIHGFHNAAALDRRLKERVVLTIGLLCHAVIEHDPVESVMNRLTSAEGNVTGFVYRDGKPSGIPLATLETGERLPAFFPRTVGYQPTTIELLNVFYRMYTPLRCLTCLDATAELADVVFGDPWMPAPSGEINFNDGFTYTLVRTARGASAIDEARRAAAVSLHRLREDQARSSNVTMGREKKSRAFRLLASRATAGLPTPNYHLRSSLPLQRRQLRVELHLLSHWFCFRTGMRSVATKILLSRLGYLFFCLNGVRRSLRRNRASRP